MKFTPGRMGYGFAALAVLAGLLLLWRQLRPASLADDAGSPGRVHVAGKGSPGRGRVTGKEKPGSSAVSPPSSVRDQTTDPAKAKRLMDLEQLMQRWMDAEKIEEGVTPSDSICALADETADLLLCGGEVIQLMTLLSDHKRSSEISLISHAIKKLFSTPRAAEARNLLNSMTERSNLETPWNNVLRDWCKTAGKECSKEEFEAFYASLKNKRFALEALFGQNQTLIHTDPKKAILSSTQALAEYGGRVSEPGWLTKLMWELPSDVDFKEIDALLPPNSPTLEPECANRARSTVIGKWAAVDAEEAYNYVMAHPEKFGPASEHMGTFLEIRMSKDSKECIKLVQTLPKAPHNDYMIETICWSYAESEPTMAQRLALEMSDPEIRKDLLIQLGAIPDE